MRIKCLRSGILNMFKKEVIINSITTKDGIETKIDK